MSKMSDTDRLDNAALSKLCSESIGVLADDIYLAREVEAAYLQIVDLFAALTERPKRPGPLQFLDWLAGLLPREPQPIPEPQNEEETARLRCRGLLHRYCLLAGEILRLWQPLAPLKAVGREESPEPHPGLERSRTLWKKMRKVGDQLKDIKPMEAERDLGKVAASLPALRKLAYDPTPETFIGDALYGHAGAPVVFAEHGLQCEGCYVAPRHKIHDAAICHPFDEQEFLRDLQALAGK